MAPRFVAKIVAACVVCAGPALAGPGALKPQQVRKPKTNGGKVGWLLAALGTAAAVAQHGGPGFLAPTIAPAQMAIASGDMLVKGSDMRNAMANQLRAARIPRKASREEVVEKASGVIREQLGLDADKEIQPEDTLMSLGADSLDIVETVMALEEEFDCELPDEETKELKNIGDVFDLIQKKAD